MLLVSERNQSEKAIYYKVPNIWYLGKGNTMDRVKRSVLKSLPSNTGDTGLMPGSGKFPGEGNDNPLQYSCLGIFKFWKLLIKLL